MTQETTRHQSPLGGLSEHFLVKQSSKGAIVDNPTLGHLELYPAGYSQPSRRDGVNRQAIHEAVFEAAVKLGAEKDLYPFKGHGHDILLVPEPDNTYDAHAIRVIIKGPSGTPLENVNGKELGYIPKRISAALSKHLDLITGGRIMKVRSGFHDKYYSTKIMLGYGNKEFHTPVERDLARFSDLWD